MKKVYAMELRLGMGEGTPVPFNPDELRKEFAEIAEFLIRGGALGDIGQITSVVGLRMQIGYALSVDAPESMWAELEAKTVPSNAIVGKPNKPQGIVTPMHPRKKRKR